jgi:Uma2 family endonuclease
LTVASVQVKPSTTPTEHGPPALLHSGDRLDQPTFHRLYEETAEGFKAELVQGRVIVASPVGFNHGHEHAKIMAWLSHYWAETPGSILLDNTTFIFNAANEPQPDAALVLDPRFGGRVRVEGDRVFGPPELAVEISYSSWSVDLNDKLHAYEAAGVSEYLVVDVHGKSLHWFLQKNGRFEPILPREDGLLCSSTFPGLWIDPALCFDAKIGPVLAALKRGLATPEHAAFVSKLGAAGGTG